MTQINIIDKASVKQVIVNDNTLLPEPIVSDNPSIPPRIGIDGRSPFIHSITKTWYQYDDQLQKYVDTGIVSEGKDLTNEFNELETRLSGIEDILDKPSEIQQYLDHNEFPSLGKTDVLYIDMTGNRSFRWDEENLKYESLNEIDIEIINGGN